MLGVYFLYEEEHKHVQPVIVIGEQCELLQCAAIPLTRDYLGPVLIGAGLMTILLSSEICARYYRESKRSLDPELDNLTNPQVSSGALLSIMSSAQRCKNKPHWPR